MLYKNVPLPKHIEKSHYSSILANNVLKLYLGKTRKTGGAGMNESIYCIC